MDVIPITEDTGLDVVDSNASLEMRYEQVYRQQGIRFVPKLLDPKLFPLEQLMEMDLSVLHYFNPQLEGTYGIPQTHPLLKNNQHRTISMHKVEMPVKGPVKKRIFNFRLAVKAYHKLNPEILWGKDSNKMRSYWNKRPWNVIIDYSLMGRDKIFRNNPMKHLFEFESKYRGYLEGVKSYLSNNQRRHQIMFYIPEMIPTIPQLKLASQEMKRSYYQNFPDYERLQLLDFWKWLNPAETRDKSIFNEYLSGKDLSRIDLLFLYKDHVVLLDAGLLERWVTGVEELNDTDEELEDEESSVSSSQARRFQKRFHQFLNLVIERVTSLPSPISSIQIDMAQANDVQKLYDTTDESKLKDEDFIDPDNVKEGVPLASQVFNQTAEEGDDKELPETSSQVLTKTTIETAQDDTSSRDIPDSLVQTSTSPTTPVDNTSSNQPPMDTNRNLSSVIDGETTKQVRNLAQELNMTVKEEKYWEGLGNTYKKLKAPGENSKTIEEFINEKPSITISKEDTDIPDIPLVTDKSMLKATLSGKNKEYIKKHLKRDIVKNLMSMQNIGVMVTDLNIERKQDVMNDIDEMSVQYTPVGGSASTVKIRIPHINDNGVMRVGNVQYYIKSQRVDLVIRKVGDNKSSITTYYGKLFFNRCDKRKYNFDKEILRLVDLSIIEGFYTDVQYGKVNTTIKDIPAIVQPLLNTYKGFTNIKDGRRVALSLSEVQQDAKTHLITFGKQVSYQPKTGTWYISNKESTEFDIFGFTQYDAPDTYAEVKILGEMIPVGFILARSMGFGRFVELLKLDFDKYESGKQIQTEPHHLVLRFNDEKWVFDKSKMSYRDRLLLSGMLAYQKYIKQYNVDDFNHKEVYGSILHEAGVNIRYERELDLMESMLIDDISRNILIEMKEPTEYIPLMMRAVELLTTSHQVEEINMDNMMISGPERISGAVYRELVKNARVFMTKPISSKRRFEMKPDDVWISIMNDPTKEVVDEINPIQELKEQEIVTFIGEGGRSRRSMVKRTRGYSDSDIGVISEATVDSFDVGITTYMSANPNLENIYGISGSIDPKHPRASQIYSTAVMLTPFANLDDGKRMNFISIQCSHRLPIKGGYPNPVRTGYENVIAHRTSDQFAHVAKGDGVIKEKGARYVIISYTSKELDDEQVTIGMSIVSSKGNYYKHDIVCDLPVGYKFKKGHVLVFNRSFFVRDVLNPTQVIMADKVYPRTMLSESNDTYEDSSAISARFSEQLTATIVKERSIVLNVTDNLYDVVKINQMVEIDDPLLIIEDAALGYSRGEARFDKDSLGILRKLSQVSPKANYKGKVVRIEVFYFSEDEALSDSIKEMVNVALKDKFTGTKSKVQDRRNMTGRITEPMKFGSQFIGPNQCCIRFYIESDVGIGAGDKVCTGSQLKSVLSRAFTDEITTETGRPIDYIFGYTSISNRIVSSPELQGTTYLLLEDATKAALRAYDGT